MERLRQPRKLLNRPLQLPQCRHPNPIPLPNPPSRRLNLRKRHHLPPRRPVENKPAPADEIVIGFGGGTTATLEREAASFHKLSVKTILRSECAKAKKNFDEEVSKFLSSIDEENLVEVHPVQYSEDDKKGNDFGLMILYKIVPEED